MKDLGCWADKEDRVIPPIEGEHSLLMDDYNTRTDPLEKCVEAAVSFGGINNIIYRGISAYTNATITPLYSD